MNTTPPSPPSLAQYLSVYSIQWRVGRSSCDPESPLVERQQQLLPLPIQKRQQQNEHRREDADFHHRTGDSIRGRDKSA